MLLSGTRDQGAMGHHTCMLGPARLSFSAMQLLSGMGPLRDSPGPDHPALADKSVYARGCQCPAGPCSSQGLEGSCCVMNIVRKAKTTKYSLAILFAATTVSCTGLLIGCGEQKTLRAPNAASSEA